MVAPLVLESAEECQRVTCDVQEHPYPRLDPSGKLRRDVLRKMRPHIATCALRWRVKEKLSMLSAASRCEAAQWRREHR